MAEQFKVGERVRFLRERQEGVVQRIISTKRLEVLIDDFVEMEVDVEDVVRIHAKEAMFKKEDEVKPLPGNAPSTPDREPCLVILRTADKDYECWLLNFGRREVYYTCYQKVHGKFKGINAGNVEPGGKLMFAKIGTHEFHMIQNLVLQLMQFPLERVRPMPMLTLEIDCKMEILNTPAKVVPEVGTEGWEFLLEEKALQAHLEQVNRPMMKMPENGPEVVDLHVEKLGLDPFGMSSAELLRLQLEHFERKITNAHALKVKQMVFIHGIGLGKLKKEIHERLRNYNFVKDYALAEPLLYGNGATIVFFK